MRSSGIDSCKVLSVDQSDFGLGISRIRAFPCLTCVPFYYAYYTLLYLGARGLAGVTDRCKEFLHLTPRQIQKRRCSSAVWHLLTPDSRR